MNLILEFDDLHWKRPENCLGEIDSLVKKYPNIKLSFFTTPNHSGLPIGNNSEWCERIRQHILNGRVCLAMHGFDHSGDEFKKASKVAQEYKIKKGEELFNQAGLDFCKCFRAPYWAINNDTYSVLIENGYSHIFSHEDYRHLQIDGIKTVYYNWNLKDDFREIDMDLIIGHGHTHNVCGNGIEESFNRISDFIDRNNPVFKFVYEA